jgi:hypothetical protein
MAMRIMLPVGKKKTLSDKPFKRVPLVGKSLFSGELATQLGVEDRLPSANKLGHHSDAKAGTGKLLSVLRRK